MVYGINAALKNIGTTLLVREFARQSAHEQHPAAGRGDDRGPDQAALHLWRRSGLQRAVRSCRWTAKRNNRSIGPISKRRCRRWCASVIYEDATSALSHWHVPAAHYLESWGDALTSEGAYLAIQPMILPLFGGVSEIELLNGLLGGPKLEGPELVQETFRASNPPGDPGGAWSQLLARWFRDASSTARQASDVQFQCGWRGRAHLLVFRAGADAGFAGDRARPQLFRGRRPLRQQRLAAGNAGPDHEADLGQCRAHQPRFCEAFEGRERRPDRDHGDGMRPSMPTKDSSTQLQRQLVIAGLDRAGTRR